METGLIVARCLIKAACAALTGGIMELVMIHWENAKDKKKEKDEEK